MQYPGDQQTIQPSEELAPSSSNDVSTTNNDLEQGTYAAHESEPLSNGPRKSPEDEVIPSSEGVAVTLNPGRKRKLGDTPTKSTTPRAASPPWKKFIAEGPTSFTIDGKRKSSRTNTLPLELQPGADKRRHTRAALSKATDSSSSPARSSRHGKQSSSVIASSPPNSKKGGSLRRKSKTQPEMPPPRSTPRRESMVNGSSSPGRKRKEMDNNPPQSSPPATPQPPPTGRKRGRPSNQEIIARKLAELKEQEEELSKAISETTASQPRLKLKIRRPITRSMEELEIRHPSQIPQKRKHVSFRAWYEAYDPFEGEDEQRTGQKEAALNAENRIRILDATEPGGLLTKTRCTTFLTRSLGEPPPQYGHFDHVVAHAMNFHGLLQKESLRHKQTARKLAHEAAAYVATKGKGDSKEQLDKEEEKRSLIRYRQVVRDVRSLWKLVGVDVQKLRLGRWEEEQHELGKQALDEMLDQSKELLNQRGRRQSSAGVSEEESDMDQSGEDEDDTEVTDIGSDDELTREQLEEKYRNIIGDSAPQSDEGEEDEEEMEMEGDDQISEDNEEDDNDDDDDQDEANGDSEDENGIDTGGGAEDVVTEEPMDLDEISAAGTPVEKHQTGTQRSGYLVNGTTDKNGSIHDNSETLDAVEDKGQAPSGDAHLTQEELLAKYQSLMSMSMDDVFANASIDDRESESGSDNDSGSSTESSSGEEDHEDDNADTDHEDTEEAPSNMLGFYMSQAEIKSTDGTQATSGTQETKLLNGHLEVDNRPPSPISLDKNMHDEVLIKSTTKISEIVDSTADGDEQTSTVKGTDAEISQDTCLVHPDPVTEKATQEDVPMLDAQFGIPVGSREHTPESMDDHEIRTPSLLRGKLRAYQHDGLDWLANLWQNGTNGILADEMGLGKTIQTIALLAHVAERGEWGPHLVVVPTSVMLNWEMEFKKWCPGFKILTYYGSQEERKNKRRGWYNSYLHQVGNVVITSYQLILQDELAFKKREWSYLVLDEAHNIKNFQSQRWQALLKFKTQRRLLLTGTPLQNSIQELWSLLYFLMPSGDDGQGGFAGLDNFTQALKRPTNQILEQGRSELDAAAQKAVSQLHTVLRPYLLRRLKADVEKQMPAKYEHVVYCRLSKRQRQLYDGFMGRADTKQTLSSGNYMSIMNCLMSLRKVCNHPDLFETRQIVTSFAMRRPVAADFEIKDLLFRKRLLENVEDQSVNLDFLNLRFNSFESHSKYHVWRTQQLRTDHIFEDLVAVQTKRLKKSQRLDSSIESGLQHMVADAEIACLDNLRTNLAYTKQRTALVRTRRGFEGLRLPLYGSDLVKHLYLDLPNRLAPPAPKTRRHASSWYLNTSDIMRELTPSLERRSETLESYVQKFACVTPNVVVDGFAELSLSQQGVSTIRSAFPLQRDPFHESRVRLSIAFPDKRLLQYDCGKLQRLAVLLRRLTSEGHRALIFTQMTKVLDILETFLNVHGYKYLRLDGSTPVEKRQVYTSQFNQDTRIPVFILSSRSGGLGLNLTGANTVIFYDLDWNPAMDRQCQDRAHRIGQTRDVHIYRFVSEYTIETNILRKSNQKRLLDDVIIQKGDFTTDYFDRKTYKDALDEAEQFGELDNDASAAMDRVLGNLTGVNKALQQVEDKEDVQALENARKEEVEEIQEDEADFNESETKETLEKKGEKSEELGHVDEYMVKHLDWELKDVPIVVEKKSKKKGTKGVLGARRKR